MKQHIFGAFQEKSFVFLWLGEVATQIAFNLFNFFLILHVYSLTRSNTAVSLVVISFTIPAIFFGLLAGVYVDRWNKKTVLLIANIIRGLLILFLAFFHTNIYLIYAVTFAVSLATQFFVPAETPMIPLVVRKKMLLSANALFGLGLYGSILIAYILSGPAIIFLGDIGTLLFLSVLFFVGSFFIHGIVLPRKNIPKNRNPFRTPKHIFMREIRSTFSLMRHSRAISNSLFLLAFSQILLLVLAVIAPGYATQILHISIQEFPLYFIAPAAVGVFIGAVLLIHFFQNISKEKVMTLGLFLSGIAMFILPYGAVLTTKQIVQTFNTLPRLFDITPAHVMMFLAFVLGLANAFIFVPSNTILQEQTSDELRGKMYGVLSAMVGIFSLIPILLVGSLSDTIGVDKVIIGIGGTLFGLGVLRMVFDI